MYWRKKTIIYDIVVPPLSKPFYDLTSEEAREYFDWHIDQIPKRIKYLTKYVSSDLGVDIDIFDFSPNSLTILWRWFLDFADIERTPKKRLNELFNQYKNLPLYLQNHLVQESSEQFSLQTEFVLRDIGMYLGEVFVKNNMSICWGYYETPKTDFYVNTPLLVGFEDKNFTPPFKMFFEPIHMVGVQAAKIWDDTQDGNDLLDLYTQWKKVISE